MSDQYIITGDNGEPLSLLVRHVLGPTLDVTDQLGVDLRRGLRDAAANAEANLG